MSKAAHACLTNSGNPPNTGQGFRPFGPPGQNPWGPGELDAVDGRAMGHELFHGLPAMGRLVGSAFIFVSPSYHSLTLNGSGVFSISARPAANRGHGRLLYTPRKNGRVLFTAF